MRNTSISKTILLFGISIAAALMATADPTSKTAIMGKVIDKQSNQPIPFALVSLGLLPDTTIKKSAKTDVNGNYTFDQMKNGRYVVLAQMVGYNKKASKAIAYKQTPVKVDDLFLESNVTLNTVMVTGKRPDIEQKADRTVLNIENSATNSGDNAYEVLRKAPGVNIDKDDKVSLKGKEGVMITINDKPTHLSGQELASYLKSLQGTEIEKVELISTPPARYEAAGNSGIINIKMKKNNKVGVNGTFTAGTTINEKVSGNTGLSLNMRKGKVNAYGSYNISRYNWINEIYVWRNMNQDTAKFYQYSKIVGHHQGQNYTFGVDYDLNKRHTFGILARGSNSDNANNIKAHSDLYLRDESLAKYLNSKNSSNGKDNNYTLNANYRMNIDTNGRALNVDADYVNYHNTAHQANDTYYFKPNGEAAAQSLLLKNNSPSDINIKSFRIDYTHPFSKTILLETGVKGSWVNSDNDLQYDRYEHSSKTWVGDIERSNHFKYEENILAAYSSLSYELEGWNFKGGLRAERTYSKGYSVNLDKSTPRTYTDLFPTFYVQRSINKDNSLTLNYNRRINRPDYSSLNPFVFRVDEYTYQEGNPFLKPQYTDNVELGHAWKNMIFTSLTFSHTGDVSTQVLEEIEISKPSADGKQTVKATKIIEKNLEAMNSVNLNVSANLNPVKWFRSNTNVTGMYSEYTRGNNQSGNSRLMYMIYSSNSFMLPKMYTLELTARYNSKMAYGMVDIDPQVVINVGVQKRFLDKKLLVKFSVDDVFNTFHSKAYARYDGMDFTTKNYWASQRFNLSISYRFGSKDVKQARQRSTSSEDEVGRTSK